MGEATSLSRQALGLIELGQGKPCLESFVGLAVALDVDAGDLLDGITWVVAYPGSPGSFFVDPLIRQFVPPAHQRQLVAAAFQGAGRSRGN